MATGGLVEAGDLYYEEGLQRLLTAANAADLTAVGRCAVRDRAWPALAKRLLLEREKARRPHVFEQPLRPPFLIMGLARTGTTHLHRLLCLDPRFDGLSLWELNDPFPPDHEPDRRREIARQRFDAARGTNVDHIHYSDPDTPEECSILHMSQFLSGLFWGVAPLYDYAEWLIALDGALDRQLYTDYRAQLLWLQSQHGDRALVLKAPDHTARIAVIAELIPEAMIVNTVRDPVPVVNSSNSLVYQYHRRTARRLDVPRMVDVNVRAIKSMWTAHRDNRVGNVSDVRFDDLVERPIDVVRSIYEFHGVDWPDGHETTLQAYLESNKEGRYGVHAYSSDDFGLADEWIREQFADYYEYFDLPVAP